MSSQPNIDDSYDADANVHGLIDFEIRGVADLLRQANYEGASAQVVVSELRRYAVYILSQANLIEARGTIISAEELAELASESTMTEIKAAEQAARDEDTSHGAGVEGPRQFGRGTHPAQKSPAAYDAYVRVKVQRSLADPRPSIPHEEVMDKIRQSGRRQGKVS